MNCSRPQRNAHWPGFEPGIPRSEIRRPIVICVCVFCVLVKSYKNTNIFDVVKKINTQEKEQVVLKYLFRLKVHCIFIGYSTVFCKIRDFICTSLRSTEIVLDER